MRIIGLNMRWFVCALLSILVLSGCGGGGGGGAVAVGGDEDVGISTSAVPARIEIAPSAVLLTELGQTKALTARVFDANGVEMKSEVQWESTHPEQVTVDASGVVSTVGSGGSSQITARIGTLASPPLLAVHTLTPVDAVLLSDAQIVGDPEETDPDAPPSFTNTYRVRLTGVAAPHIGELLISTEAKAVAGRVIAVESNAGVHVVTLTPSSLRETFPHLAIDEVIDLSQAEVVVPEAVSSQFDVVRDGTTFTFTPKNAGAELPLVLAKSVQAPGVVSKPSATVNVRAATGTIATGPLGECKFAVDGASGAGSLPISVLPSSPFSVDINPSLQTIYTSQNGLERLVLHAEPTVSAGLEFKVLVAFEGKVTCDLELFIFRIPVGGPLSLFVGGLVPVGIGAELGGKFTFADMALGARASAKTTVDTGIVCPQGSCTMLAQADAITTTFTPTLNGPGLADFRFEPSLTVYGFAKASFGSAIFNSLRFDALAIKAGPALKGNFAPREVQMADPAYKSDYQLAGIIKAGADTQFGGFLNLLGLAGIAETALLDKSFPLATSPAGTVSADVASFVTGDTVNFTVKLDPASREFLGIDNVSQVLLVRNDLGQTVVARTNVAAGQTEISLPFTAPNAGSASEFFAFVVPVFPSSMSLELGQASSSAPAPQGQRLAAGHVHSCAISSGGALKCWGFGQDGQLGNGSTASSLVPVDVTGLGSGVVAVSAGSDHSCAISSGGALKCWGNNTLFQLGYDILGDVNLVPTDVPGLGSSVVAVTAGNQYTCAVTSGGALKCWGIPFDGQLGNGSNGDSNQVLADVPGLGSGVVAVAASVVGAHTCAVTSGGALKCWGSNFVGQLGNGSTASSLVPVDVTGLGSGVVAVATGSDHACAVTSGGAVKCWGFNELGRLGNGSTASSSVPVDVTGLGSGVIAVSAGGAHSCALLGNGDIKCWGSGGNGRLGSGSTIESAVPVDVIGFP